MAKKAQTPAAATDANTGSIEPMYIEEVIKDLDLSAGLLGHAEQSFIDIGAIFDAIVAAAPKGSLMSRLAQLGTNLTATLECDFEEYSDHYLAHAERYSASLPSDPLRRFRSVEESSRGDAG
jgi:hypothetical protein